MEEGYLEQPSRTEDDVIQPVAENLSAEDQTTEVSVISAFESDEPMHVSQEEATSGIPMEYPTSSRGGVEVPRDTETDSFGFERAAVLGIPVVIAAGSIGIMATATHSRQPTPPNQPHDHPPTLTEHGATVDHVPAIHVETPTSPDQKDTFEIHGPFIEPLKHHIQPDEITPVLPDSTALRSPHMPIPYEPTHLPPMRDLPRPSTSYSWLGNLFGPISPEIVEAQRTGWIAISTETTDESPVRRRSTKLRRRAREIFTREQVLKRNSHRTNLAGRGIPGMWNYVRGRVEGVWKN